MTLDKNRLRNKFDDLRHIINGKIDILSIAEKKYELIDASTPSAQLTLQGYHSPYRLDSSGILVYVKY